MRSSTGRSGSKAYVVGSCAQLPAVLLDQRLGRFQQPLPIRTLGTRFAHPTIGYLLHLRLPALDLALGDVIDAARGQARAHFGFCIGEDASDLAGQRDAAVRASITLRTRPPRGRAWLITSHLSGQPPSPADSISRSRSSGRAQAASTDISRTQRSFGMLKAVPAERRASLFVRT